MAYCGYITILKDVREHPNADRLVLATCFGNTVCVAKDKYFEGQRGVYFPTDGQLSMEFCEQNGLLAKYENGINVSGGYMDPEKRNVKAIKLRGEKSDGLFLPLECLAYTGADVESLDDCFQITTLNGHEICKKYIPKRKNRAGSGQPVAKKKPKVNTTPMFFEHKDTEQLAYNLDQFKPGDLIEITRKLHGTSGRTTHSKVLDGYKRTFWDKICRREGEPVFDWGYATGTRRTVLDSYDGGFYGSNEFREQYHKKFEGKLLKGETVYYEIVGFTTEGTPIMASCDNKKLKDKEFTKIYGDTTIFSYGCSPNGKKTVYGHDEEGHFALEQAIPQSDIYVYRMTMTNEDGDVIEYSPDFMRHRCEYIGVKCVPVEWYGFIPEHPASADDDTITAGEWVLNKVEQFYDGPEPIDPTHIREGCVVRIINRPGFCAYKHKNFNFKCISGIITESLGDKADTMDDDILSEL